MTDTIYPVLIPLAFVIGLILGATLGGLAERGYQRTYDRARYRVEQITGTPVRSRTERIEHALTTDGDAPGSGKATAVAAQLAHTANPAARCRVLDVKANHDLRETAPRQVTNR